MKAIILCGGLSTRLGEITKSIPKALLEIKGRTVLSWQVEKLKTVGVTEVVLAAGHLAEELRRAVGGELDGVKMIYAIEPERLGTGGAIKFAWSYLPESFEPTIVLNGDVLSDVDLTLMSAQLRPESDGLLFGAQVPDASSYGILEFDEGKKLSAFKEKEGLNKPGYINGGIYLFNESVRRYFDLPQAKFSVEYDVFPRVRDLDVYPFDGAWIDIGVPERLEWARENWK